MYIYNKNKIHPTDGFYHIRNKMKVTIITTINKHVCVNKQTKHNFYTNEHQLFSVILGGGVGSFRPFYPFAPGSFRPSDPPWIDSPLYVGRFALPGESFRPQLINTDMCLCLYSLRMFIHQLSLNLVIEYKH